MPRGDTDRAVNVSDVLQVLRWAVGLDLDPPLSDEEWLRADLAPNEPAGALAVVVGDGALDIADVLVLLRAAVGLEQLAWPERTLRIGTREELEAVAFRAATSGWPAWASLADDPDACAGADGGWDAAGSSWVLSCATDPHPLGTPETLATIHYRAPEVVHPAGLGLQLTVVDGALQESPAEGYLARPVQ
jgi:hypothetical protein